MAVVLSSPLLPRPPITMLGCTHKSTPRELGCVLPHFSPVHSVASSNLHVEVTENIRVFAPKNHGKYLFSKSPFCSSQGATLSTNLNGQIEGTKTHCVFQVEKVVKKTPSPEAAFIAQCFQGNLRKNVRMVSGSSGDSITFVVGSYFRKKRVKLTLRQKKLLGL